MGCAFGRGRCSFQAHQLGEARGMIQRCLSSGICKICGSRQGLARRDRGGGRHRAASRTAYRPHVLDALVGRTEDAKTVGSTEKHKPDCATAALNEETPPVEDFTETAKELRATKVRLVSTRRFRASHFTFHLGRQW